MCFITAHARQEGLWRLGICGLLLIWGPFGAQGLQFAELLWTKLFQGGDLREGKPCYDLGQVHAAANMGPGTYRRGCVPLVAARGLVESDLVLQCLGHQTETGRCPWRRSCFLEMLPFLTLSFDCSWRREVGSCSNEMKGA